MKDKKVKIYDKQDMTIEVLNVNEWMIALFYAITERLPNLLWIQQFKAFLPPPLQSSEAKDIIKRHGQTFYYLH